MPLSLLQTEFTARKAHVLQDRNALRGLLNDCLSSERAKVNQLWTAVECGVLDKIIDESSPGNPLFKHNTVKLIEGEHGYSPEVCAWVVDVWVALVLGTALPDEAPIPKSVQRAVSPRSTGNTSARQKPPATKSQPKPAASPPKPNATPLPAIYTARTANEHPIVQRAREETERYQQAIETLQRRRAEETNKTNQSFSKDFYEAKYKWERLSTRNIKAGDHLFKYWDQQRLHVAKEFAWEVKRTVSQTASLDELLEHIRRTGGLRSKWDAQLFYDSIMYF